MVFIGKKAKVDDLTSDFVLMGINCQVKNAHMINYLIQWGSEIRTCPVFEWSEVGRL